MRLLQCVLFLVAPLVFSQCSTGDQAVSETADSGEVQTAVDLPLGDNSRVSLDWPGSYSGILPCADCPGIYTAVILNDDGTYLSFSKYLGKSEEADRDSGEFEWDETGGIIRLPSAGKTYRVGENMLIQLDDNGDPMSGDSDDSYLLYKRGQQITGQYWRLVRIGRRDIPETDSDNRPPHLLLFPDSGRMTGYTGCNAINGKYSMDGLRLSFSQVASTLRACSEMDYEPEFLQVLERTDNYSLNPTGDTLSLNRARMAPLAILVAALPD